MRERTQIIMMVMIKFFIMKILKNQPNYFVRERNADYNDDNDLMIKIFNHENPEKSA